jgi:hypothetical protein
LGTKGAVQLGFGKAPRKAWRQCWRQPSPSRGGDPKNVPNAAASDPLTVYNCIYSVTFIQRFLTPENLTRMIPRVANFAGCNASVTHESFVMSAFNRCQTACGAFFAAI